MVEREPLDVLPVLPADELKRRIEAARVLRGITQVELDRLLHGDGFGKGDAGRVERGEIEMRKARREAFSRHLRVPERWFLADDVDEIVGWISPPSAGEGADALATRLLAAALELAQAQEQEPPDDDKQDRYREAGEGDPR